MKYLTRIKTSESEVAEKAIILESTLKDGKLFVDDSAKNIKLVIKDTYNDTYICVTTLFDVVNEVEQYNKEVLGVTYFKDSLECLHLTRFTELEAELTEMILTSECEEKSYKYNEDDINVKEDEWLSSLFSGGIYKESYPYTHSLIIEDLALYDAKMMYHFRTPVVSEEMMRDCGHTGIIGSVQKEETENGIEITIWSDDYQDSTMYRYIYKLGDKSDDFKKKFIKFMLIYNDWLENECEDTLGR